MKSAMEKEWNKLLAQEEQYLFKGEEKAKAENGSLTQSWTTKVRDKIPDKLVDTLEAAFYKGFFAMFTKGAGAIEKTFRSEEVALEFEVNDFRMNKKPTKKALRQVEKQGKRSRRLNSCLTTVEGIGLGALGIGLPDIPIFLGMLLKGLYETAAGYGYDYKDTREQVFILRIITAALASGEELREADQRVDMLMKELGQGVSTYSMEEEVRKASGRLSQSMLASKFVQGFLIVGAVGGVMNLVIYRQVMGYALLKYKKRYLMGKQKCV